MSQMSEETEENRGEKWKRFRQSSCHDGDEKTTSVTQDGCRHDRFRVGETEDLAEVATMSEVVANTTGVWQDTRCPHLNSVLLKVEALLDHCRKLANATA